MIKSEKAADQRPEIIRTTSQGNVRVRTFCRPEEIEHYRYSSEFGTHAQFKSLYTKKESLARIAAKPDANVTLALAEGDHIVAFGILDAPDPDERWAALGSGSMYEVKAIEVSRSWRAMRLADAIVGMLLSPAESEERIVYLVGYSWTWDLDGTGKTAVQYRNVLKSLFEPHGFQEMQTNEPNICLKPENLFMARIGKAVSGEVVERFKWLRFGISP